MLDQLKMEIGNDLADIARRNDLSINQIAPFIDEIVTRLRRSLHDETIRWILLEDHG